ncbi:MAG: hypothetical protein COS99_08145 [Candidatus Omnitrophica bacterium CG07_land_8_20_14_0_80_42_15]|uniref:Prepilin-type N-terminal cleavage/methylation domain-containing protein n=1 Tax=Candidatus Aquitaenariimonas noxiae TaxID=1974741 RepID=A0A2J0L0V9_9BACT|nr:MAG: hypothetical protein COS99_08145 [Candidatus Omnitrophica bacterium CG07_land_8_20_14_0_80_42_15]
MRKIRNSKYVPPIPSLGHTCAGSRKSGKYRNSDKGLTLIELIMTIVIASVILIPVSVVIIESVQNAFLPEHFIAVSSLLESELERVTNLRFSNVVNEGPTEYTGNFSDYSHQVSYYYVDSGNLNTLSASPSTNYKRIQITVSRPGFPSVEAVTLATNN